ncbi:hypothetical protein Q5H92_26455 [Hymenobacter sp. M29]|uniref:Uncharacterized protein n=1 Tax=Hymenobacter mellowenesis TaxID=3063995 RepID=A0ABT9AJ88_9BACT|nr:hypothetical protein [Hymenobacter sp. M29]MDO7849929.1 hypothetical protein [Hymenobacter sp. M29]
MTQSDLTAQAPTDIAVIWKEVLSLRSQVAQCLAKEQELRGELSQHKAFQSAFIESLDDQVTTKKALDITGIKSRTTLIAERDRPDSLLAYTHNGRAVTYSRAGCVAHALARQAA